ncbi:MAG: vWA domain-containing protein [Alphaproteobacteria bacterium]
MDDKQLAKILSEDRAPEIDVNAKKRAMNLAMAEFKTAQNEKNQKNSQGVSFLSRLIGIGNQNRGRQTMEQRTKKRFMYGAGATAMALVLVAGLSLTQVDETVNRFEGQKPNQTNQSTNNFGQVSNNISKPIPSIPIIGKLFSSDAEIAPAYIDAIEQQNEEGLERAIRDGSTAIPVPIETSKTRQEESNVSVRDDPLADWKRLQDEPVVQKNQQNRTKDAGGKASETEAKADKPLHRWRALQEERVEREMAVASTPARAPAAIAESKEEAVASSVAKSKKVISGGQQLYNTPENIIVADDYITPTYQDEGRDKFEEFKQNPFKSVDSEPVSTFSSDVDTASYSFVRKSLNSGRLPNASAVRVEELVNYFNYNYPVPESRAEPFLPSVTVVDSPWAEGRKLMHVGIKGYQIEPTELRSNLVFLLDVSGSMNAQDKLPLVKNSMKMLLDSLHPDDTVSIVVYAGSTGVVLEPTKVSKRNTILNAMNALRAGGGTAGAAGIELAYNMAEQNFDKGAVNRVILATDGDFNVGISNHNELKKYVERKRDKGIFLSVLGFGQGNYNDQMMQTLAQNGNGVAAYIDNLNEARKVLVQEATSSLFPIAKDVKFQVEFNPNLVSEYRLIGYETRSLKREDFNNDKIDAGDIGAGHTVTAIYEFVPVGSNAGTVDPLRYGKKAKSEVKKKKPLITNESEYAYLKMRYKLPMESKSKLMTRPVTVGDETKGSPCPPHAACLVAGQPHAVAFATAVAAFGQILKGGEHTGDFSYDDVIALAQQGKGNDQFGYRAEFINMVRLAKTLAR